MKDYTKLVEALRETAKHLDGISRFPYDDDPAKRIYSKKMADAADAIEALQAEIRESMQRCAECGDELAHQMPKRGEWIGIEYDGYADGNPVYDVWECSECGEEHEGEEDTLTNYCPNCGAKMEVQDG